jgi:hypothetical protein
MQSIELKRVKSGRDFQDYIEISDLKLEVSKKNKFFCLTKYIGPIILYFNNYRIVKF